jgi:hypothetical protein
MPPASPFRHLNPVPEHSDTGLGPLISVKDCPRHRHFNSFRNQTDQMPHSPTSRPLKTLNKGQEGYTLHVFTDGVERDTLCTSLLTALKNDTLCTSLLTALKNDTPSTSLLTALKNDTPCTSLLTALKNDTTCTSLLTALKRDTPCTFTLLSAKMDTPCTPILY